MKKTLIVLTACLVLAACASAPPPPTAGSDPAGFLEGLWHGLILPIAFICSLFDDGIGIYETVNSGGWYDLGFLIGASAVLGGSGSAAR